jgi:DNA-binding beta-propeller fold protein YncE
MNRDDIGGVRAARSGALPGMLLSLSLAACGSGGGSSSSGSPPVVAPPPVAETPPADQRLALTASSAKAAFGLAFDMTDLGVSFATVALEVLTARLQAGGVAPLGAPCETGGSLSMSLEDLDRSGALSPGDAVGVTFDGCASPEARLDGALRIRVAAASDGSTEQLRRGTLDIVRFVQTDGSDVLTLRGGVGFTFTATAAQDRLELEATELVATLAGRSETLSAFSYRFVAAQNGSGFETTATGTVRSETLPGTFTFTQPSSWRGPAGQWPTAGVLSITGRNGSSARLDQFDPAVANPPGRVALLLDLDGNGSLETSQPLPWTDFVDAAYFAPVLRDPLTPRPTGGSAPPVTAPPGASPLTPPIPVPGFTPASPSVSAAGRALGLGVQPEPGGAVFDARRDRVYLADPFGNRIVVLSAATWLPLETIAVGSTPRGLALASTGDELYVALAQGGAVAIVNLVDRSLRRIELERALGTTEISHVAELRPGKLLVSGGNGTLGTVDLDAVPRARALAAPATLPRAKFELSADRRAAYALAEGSTGRIARLDLTATEPTVVLARDVVGSAESGALGPLGERLVLGNGTVVDTTGLTLLERGALGGSVGRRADYSRMLLTASPQRLVDAGTLAVLQSFAVSCNAGGQPGVLSIDTRDQWLLYGAGQQCVFSTAAPAAAPGIDGTRQLPAPPQVLDRSGRAIQIASGFSERAVDHALDDPAGLVYVSLPTPGQVAVVSIASNTVVTRIAVGAEPGRLLLSADRRWLYVALTGSGELAVVDTASRLVVARIPLGPVLGTNLIRDLVEIRPDVIVAAGQPADFSAAPLVEANRVAPHSPQRVGRTAGYANAALLVSPDRTRLYVIETTSARIVESRDLGAAGYPVVETSPPRAPISGGPQTSSTDGDRLYVGGEVLASATLTRLGVVASGRPVIPTPGTGPAAGALHIASDGIVNAFDVATFQRLYSLRLTCPDSPLITPGLTVAIGFETLGRVVYSPSRDEFVMLQPSVGALCVVPRQP